MPTTVCLFREFWQYSEGILGWETFSNKAALRLQWPPACCLCWELVLNFPKDPFHALWRNISASTVVCIGFLGCHRRAVTKKTTQMWRICLYDDNACFSSAPPFSNSWNQYAPFIFHLTWFTIYKSDLLNAVNPLTYRSKYLHNCQCHLSAYLQALQ